MIFVLHNNRYIAEDYVVYSLALEECRSEQSAVSVERICDELDPTGRLLELVNNKALKMMSRY